MNPGEVWWHTYAFRSFFVINFAVMSTKIETMWETMLGGEVKWKISSKHNHVKQFDRKWGEDHDKGYIHGYDEWPECVVCMCSCFEPLDISADRLLMLVDIQSHCPLFIVMGPLTPSTSKTPHACISGSSVVIHTRPGKETFVWHIAMWIWLNMDVSVGRRHQLGLAVSMFLEWLGEGMDEGGVVEHNTAQYMPCTLIECKKCKSPLSN